MSEEHGLDREHIKFKYSYVVPGSTLLEEQSTQNASNTNSGQKKKVILMLASQTQENSLSPSHYYEIKDSIAFYNKCRITK